MDSIHQTLDLFGKDIIRAIIEVTSYHLGRVSFDVVAKDLKDAAHCPEFEGDGASMLKILLAEYRGLFDGMIVKYDDKTRVFYGGV